MSAQRRTQIIVVGGALAIASAAYGLGTQAGGGNAVADNSPDGERGARVMLARGPCGPSGLADELGVDESKLEAALRDFREQNSDRVRGNFAKELADALGVSEDRVRKAMDDARGEFGFRFGPPLRGLAGKLGVTEEEMRDALEEVGKRSRERLQDQNDELAQFLADRLGLDVDKVREALPAMPPRLRSMHPPGLPDHPPAP